MEFLEENETLFRAWAGEKNRDKYIEKMKKGGFSWLSFFLPGLYITGRKMYLFGVIILLIDMLLIDVIKIIPLTFVFRIIMGFSFYPMYRFHISKKIKKYENLPYEEQIKKAELFGGDKLDVATTIIMTIMILAYFFAIGYSGVMQNKKNAIQDIQSSETSNTTAVFQGDEFTLKYNTSKWSLSKLVANGELALKHKNTSNYLYGDFAGSSKFDDSFSTFMKDSQTYDILYDKMAEEFNSLGTINKLKDGLDEINDNLYVAEFSLNTNDNANITIYMYYKYDKSKGMASVYRILVNNLKKDNNFANDLKEVLSTIEFDA